MNDQSLWVRAERIRSVYRYMPAVLAVNGAIGLLLVIALWPKSDGSLLILWSAALALATLLRMALWLNYRRRAPDGDAQEIRWGHLFALGSAISGLVWGSTAVFATPDEPVTLLVVTFVVAGMAAGAVSGLSSYLPAFYLFILASVLPLSWRLIAAADRTSVTMGVMAIVFAVALTVLGRRVNDTFSRNLLLTADKQRLLDATEAQVEARTAQLREAQEEAARQANQLDSILSTISDQVFMLCWSGVLRYANPAAMRAFGIVGPVGGRRWSDLGLPPEEVEALETMHRTVMESGSSITADLAHPTTAGVRCYEFSLTPMKDPDGRIGAVMAVSRDITAHVDAEMALLQARMQAEQADQAKSRFLAAASHDLRQPMQSMFLFAGVLRRHVHDQQGIETLAMLERGLDTLKGLLESLLDVSRLDANVISPEMSTFPLRPLLEEIGATYVPVASTKGLSLETGGCDVHVRSDRTLLGRMIRNLVENAVRYTETGSIRVLCRRSGDTVRIDVIDTGIGIAQDQLQHIFEEFHQVSSSSRDAARGLGLGLAIVKRLSEILGHEVAVQTELGRGSVFSVTVPMAASPAEADAAEEPPASAVGDGRTVLLLEDDVIVLLGLRAILESWNYRALMASSTEQAFEALQGGASPDLIIADYRLRSGATGTEAVAALRNARGRPLPAIILTGETGAEIARDVAGMGLVLIQKPVTPAQLARALDVVLTAPQDS